MSGYLPGEQPRGGKFIKLNTNENPYPASPKVATAIGEALAGGLAKYPDPLATGFRMRAAEVLGVEPDWILCGNGSDDILTIMVRTFAGPGDVIRYPYPTYVLYKTLAQIQDVHADAVLFERDWTLGDAFVAPIDNLKLAILANPNSPSGTLIPPNEILEIANQLPCPLLVDEAYGEFADSNCLELVRQNEKIMVSRTLSKSYALAGLRFGFVVAQPRLIEQLSKVKDSYNCDTLSIAGATAAIDDQAWLAENRTRIIASRSRFEDELSALGFTVQPSQANFVWCTFPERPLKPIYEALKQTQILVRYMAYDGWEEGIRITVGTDEQIDACLLGLRGIMV